MFDIECGFISKLLECRDVATLKDSRITSTFFTGDGKRAFKFIMDSVIDLGEIPTVRVFERSFPNYPLESHEVDGVITVGTEESFKFWCEELKKRKKHNTLADLADSLSDKLSELRTEEAYQAIKKEITFIESELEETTDVDLTQNTEDRIQAYLEKKKSKGIKGIPTGFKHLDYILRGLEDSTLTTMIATTGVGKAVTLGTPILTPDGYIPMRDIKLGSIVYDGLGNKCSVVGVFPQGLKDVYRITFEDGTYVDCCEDHLWKFKTTDDLNRKKPWRVETLKSIIESNSLRIGKSYNLCIPVNDAVSFPDKILPVSPYLLGCLLGDGGFTSDRITFTNPEEDVVHKVSELAKNYNGIFIPHKGNEIQYCFRSNNPKFCELYRLIKNMGIIGLSSSNKFIPDIYKYSSIEQRFSIIQGLVDTDGHVNEKGHVSFYTKSERLKDDFCFIIRSLGYKCTYSRYPAKNYGFDYVCRISAGDDAYKFFTSKKHSTKFLSRIVPKRNNHYDIMKVVSIDKLPYQEEMQCISVDSPDHTFICGDFKVTHNTWFQVILGARCQLANYRVLQLVTEMSEDIMRDRYEAVLFSMCYGSFNYNDFKSGKLSPSVEKTYFEFLREDLPHFEPLYISTANGVMGVAASIEKYDPDIVLIDSVYLMEDDQGAKDDWLRVAHITRDLKKLAKRCKKPIVINTQADKNTSRKTGPELGSIMYTQAVGQDSDNVIALYRDEVMISDNEMGIRVLKQREGSLGKLVVNWDFETMNFSEIFMDNPSDSEDADNTIEI